MFSIVGWDVETHLIEDGNLTPKLVCASFAGGASTFDAALHWATSNADRASVRFDGEAPDWTLLVTAKHVADVFCYFIEEYATMVAHNHPYDLGVLVNEWPDFVPVILNLMEKGRLRDTQVREKLLAIAEDNFNFDSRTSKKPGGFSLAYLVGLYFGQDISGDKKDPMSWRLRFSELDGVPLNEWPNKAKNYATADAVWCRRIYLQQAQERSLPEGVLVNSAGMVTNEIEQSAAALSLHWMACHGVRTDGNAVKEFERVVTHMAQQADVAAEMAGFLRINKCRVCDGTGKEGQRGIFNKVCYECAGERGYLPKRCKVPLAKDSVHRKRLQAIVTHTYGGEPPLTKPTVKFPLGQVKTDADTLKGSGNVYLNTYAEGTEYKKLLSTYLPILRSGVEKPITSSPNVLVRSGRTSWRAPNFQNPPRKGGFRECFVPRPGKVFASIDYASLELCTLAQVNLKLFRYSKMAEALIEGRDLHLEFAAQLLCLPYTEAAARLAEGDKVIKKARQDAKACNFGFPGGLGVAAFVEYAASMGVSLSFNGAQDLKNQWMETWPEMKNYFEMIAHATDTSETGRFTVRQIGSDRLRGGCSYTSGANTFWQGLASDGCKSAMWYLTKAMYSDEASPLFGVRCWAFIHDEFLFEGPEETSHLWAPAASDIMVSEMQKYTPNIPIKAEPALMRRWHKDAEPVYEGDKLVVWEEEE